MSHKKRPPPSTQLWSKNWRETTPALSLYQSSWRSLSCPDDLLSSENSCSMARSFGSRSEGGQYRKAEACKQVKLGQIVFIPSHFEIGQDSVARKAESHNDTFCHPAVVVRIYSGKQVAIKIITSLGHQSLKEKIETCKDRDKELFLKAHLLIWHPDNINCKFDNPDSSMPTLKLKDGKHLAYPSYVRMDKDIPIERSELRRYLRVGSDEDAHMDERSLAFIQSYEATSLFVKPHFDRPQRDPNWIDDSDLNKAKTRSLERMALRSASSASTISSVETISEKYAWPPLSAASAPATPTRPGAAAAKTKFTEPEEGIFLGFAMSFAQRVKLRREADKTNAIPSQLV